MHKVRCEREKLKSHTWTPQQYFLEAGSLQEAKGLQAVNLFVSDHFVALDDDPLHCVLHDASSKTFPNPCGIHERGTREHVLLHRRVHETARRDLLEWSRKAMQATRREKTARASNGTANTFS